MTKESGFKVASIEADGTLTGWYAGVFASLARATVSAKDAAQDVPGIRFAVLNSRGKVIAIWQAA